MAKRALGRGLDALLGDADAQFADARPSSQGFADSTGAALPAGITRGEDGALFAPVEKLVPNPHQPRREFDSGALAELASSIRENGVIQPITIEAAGNGKFYIIAGERRTRAAKLAGLKIIPVQIKKYSDNKKLEIALIENIQREDLNPIEEARAYAELMELNNFSQEETARRVGKKRSTVANALRLLRLSEEMQAALIEGTLSAGHARAVLSVNDDSSRHELFKKIAALGISVREAEQDAQILNAGGTIDSINDAESIDGDALSAGAGRAAKKGAKKDSGAKDSRDPDLISIEQKFIDALGTKVSVKGDFDRGVLQIEYFSRADLDRVYEIITRE